MMPIKRFPVNVAISMPAAQPVFPSPFCVLKVHFQLLVVSSYTEVLVMASQFLTELLPLFPDQHMSIPLAPLPDGLHGSSHFLGFGFSLNHPVSLL